MIETSILLLKKENKLAVIGLGYVGLPLALEFAKKVSVIGFDINKKLCFSNSSYHKESWSPMWTIKTIILGFLSFFLEKSSSGIGHLTTSIEEKNKYAIEKNK